jgi:hypothetical protein
MWRARVRREADEKRRRIFYDHCICLYFLYYCLLWESRYVLVKVSVLRSRLTLFCNISLELMATARANKF